MAISEADRSDLYNGLRDVLGIDRAETLMSAIPLHDLDEVATKGDVAELREATRADIAELREATRADIAGLRESTGGDVADLRAEISDLRAELKGEISDLRAELKDEISDLRADLHKTMTTWFLTFTTVIIGALGGFALLIA